jgi:hippurate hydrolase
MISTSGPMNEDGRMYARIVSPTPRVSTYASFCPIRPCSTLWAVGALVLLTVCGGMVAPSCRAATLAAWLDDQLPELVAIYQRLHQMPELSGQEEQTAAEMAKQLRALSFQVTTQVGGHGVVGVLANGSGPTLLLRADLDALPVAEATGLPYASQVRVRDARGATVGVMHACGHDLHMTNLIGTIKYLVEHRSAWRGTLIAILQPAEETGAGAKAMLEDGLFRRFPRPDYCLAVHVAGDKPAGTIAYRAGYAMANVDSVDIVLHGRGGHGAHPHQTIDPIVMAARLVLDLQTIVSREIEPTAPAVVTVGSIHGGSKHNVISDHCTLQLTVRSYAPEVRQRLLDAVRRKALATAASAGAEEPTVEISEGTPALYNDPELTTRVVPVLREALGAERVVETEPTMGGEDFGRLGGAGPPILMLGLGTVAPERLAKYAEQGAPPPSLHSPEYYPDAEPSLRGGVTALVSAALELLRP